MLVVPESGPSPSSSRLLPLLASINPSCVSNQSLALSTDHPLNEKEMLARLFTTDELLNILNVKLNKGRKK